MKKNDKYFVVNFKYRNPVYNAYMVEYSKLIQTKLSDIKISDWVEKNYKYDNGIIEIEKLMPEIV